MFLFLQSQLRRHRPLADKASKDDATMMTVCLLLFLACKASSSGTTVITGACCAPWPTRPEAVSLIFWGACCFSRPVRQAVLVQPW